MLLRFYYQEDNYTHYHLAFLSSSGNMWSYLLPFYLNTLAQCSNSCDFWKSWWSICHLEFCMSKTKPIIYAPLNPLLKLKFVSFWLYLYNIFPQWVIAKSCHFYLKMYLMLVSCSVKAQDLIFSVLDYC